MRGASVVSACLVGGWFVATSCQSTPHTPNFSRVGDDGGGASADGKPDQTCAAAPNSVGYGAACSCSSDCINAGTNLCFTEEPQGSPRGACWQSCLTASRACPAGTQCIQVGANDALGVCMSSCTTSAQCRDGQACMGSVCRPNCQRDQQCASNHCNKFSGFCTSTTETGGGLNATCLRNEDCRSGFCSTDIGRCLTLCALDAGCGTGVCVGVDPTLPSAGICMNTCATDTDCGDGLSCISVSLTHKACFLRSRGPLCAHTVTAVSPLGGPCTCADECPLSARCMDEASSQVPGGICLRACALPAGADVGSGTDCGADGFACALTQSTFDGACFNRCTSSAECGVGRMCSKDEGCKPFCQSDADCSTGPCNRYNGWCDSTPDPNWGPIGASCDKICQGFCKTAGPRTFCSALCKLSAPGCPDGAVCTDDGDGDDVGYCMLP